MIHQCGNVDGNGARLTRTVIAGTTGNHDGFTEINPISVTFATGRVFISTLAAWWAWGYWTPVGGWTCAGGVTADCRTAFYRVIAWR